MKRTIAILLLCLELTLATLLLAGSVAFFVLAPRAFPRQELARLQQTLAQAAQTLEQQNARLADLEQKILPGYAVHFREISALTGQGEELLAALRRNPALPILGLLGFPQANAIAELSQLTENLEALLPRISRTSLQASQYLEDTAQKDLPPLRKTFSDAACALRELERKTQTLQETGPQSLRTLGAFATLLPLLLLCLAASNALTLPPPGKPSP
ncbi:MAG: hypothetical protein ACI4SG_06015 [Oligosphaeraceae bacterium]